MDKKMWRTERWPPLAWLETVIKLVGMVFGFAALITALRVDVLQWPSGLPLFQWVVLLLLSIGLLAAIFDRLQEREIIAMGFVILNNLAHWGMVFGLLTGLSTDLRAFSAFFLVGDIIKVVFIRMHRFQVRDYGPRTLYFLTGIYIVGYLLLLISTYF